MKDWDKLEADVNMLLTKHYSKGRGGNKIDKVVVHYNAGDLSIGGCYSVWQTREASAHYQVESDGDIGQLVYDGNTAWHCGVWNQNQRSIGIEHANKADGTITEECLDNGAHLVAAVCKYFGLGRPEWLVNVFPHKYFKSTSCPGQIYGSQKDDYMARAQYWYDKMGGKDVQKPASKPIDTTTSANLGSYKYWGPKYTKELQRQRGTQVDGIISRQPKSNRKYCQNMETTSWVFSSTIRLPNGYTGSMLIKDIQTLCKNKGFYSGNIDGWFGKQSAIGLQKLLKSWGYSVGSYGCNGYFGPDSCTALGHAIEDGKFKK